VFVSVILRFLLGHPKTLTNRTTGTAVRSPVGGKRRSGTLRTFCMGDRFLPAVHFCMGDRFLPAQGRFLGFPSLRSRSMNNIKCLYAFFFASTSFAYLIDEHYDRHTRRRSSLVFKLVRMRNRLMIK
jgi:hypothetical protein